MYILIRRKIGVSWERENDIGMEEGHGRVNGFGLVWLVVFFDGLLTRWIMHS